jgi:hypothetical protein
MYVNPEKQRKIMKTVIPTTIIILIFTTDLLMAQPLPPTTPEGNPLPLGITAGMLLFAGFFYAVLKRKKLTKY